MNYLRHSIFCIAAVLNFAIIQPVLSSNAPAIESSIVCDGKQDLLNRAPLYEKESVPQATVGIIPYRFKDDGTTEVFLGQEKKDSTWSDFGGKYEITDANILLALQREFREETGGTLVPKESTELSSSVLLYINKIGKREVFYLFVQFDNVAFIENDEKNAARWFDLNTLRTQTEFPLRSFFRADLIDSEYFTSIQDLLNTRK